VLLVTPVRDGMNLVAKEYVATRITPRGVLILSEMAGASRELGEAITVNPTTREEIAQALESALEMPADEQAKRIRAMQERLRKYDVRRWAEDFIERLASVREEQRAFTSGIMRAEHRNDLVERYRTAGRRLLLLDYDGTLVPFAPRPEAARPSLELIRTLEQLSVQDRTDLVLVSGRPREVLDAWFTVPTISLVAEHGAWMKRAVGGQWRMMRPLRNEWKQQVLPIMRAAADRLPGSFVEEKEYTLVWHYRQADPELGSLRAKELADSLVQLTANMDLVVAAGHRVVEVRDSAMSKAHAALEFLALGSYDLVLAIGDDATDEDMFRVLPKSAFTIRVGITGTHARFNLAGHEDVIRLLDRLVDAGRRDAVREENGRRRTSST
jgi:trehalose 6-phosphate synthase/phosphatase